VPVIEGDEPVERKDRDRRRRLLEGGKHSELD